MLTAIEELEEKHLWDIGKTVKGEYTLKPEFKDAIANLGKIAALQSDISPSIKMRRINQNEQDEIRITGYDC